MKLIKEIDMIIIKIQSEIKTRDVQGKKGAFTVRFQEAELIYEDRRARYVEVTPPRDQSYTVDELYTLDSHSVRTNDYDRLELSRYVDLVPLSKAVEFATQCLSGTSA